jgi:hypothetical protein
MDYDHDTLSHALHYDALFITETWLTSGNLPTDTGFNSTSMVRRLLVLMDVTLVVSLLLPLLTTLTPSSNSLRTTRTHYLSSLENSQSTAFTFRPVCPLT